MNFRDMIEYMFVRKKRIFFDYAAGTPIDTQVLKKMKPYFSERFFNPSLLYREALEVSKDIETARALIAETLLCRKQEVFFVDGATEANNFAIRGILQEWKKTNTGQAHIITSIIEHPSVLEVCKQLEREGVLVSYLPVNEEGVIDCASLKEALQENTLLVSLGYVNGEIGTIQDIHSCAKIIRHHRKQKKINLPYFHTDAVQAINYGECIEPIKLGVDMMTFNASKIYGPKKIAALFIKTGVPIESSLWGGNQEKGFRPGTENVPAIIGLSQALKQTREYHQDEGIRLQQLQNLCIQEIKKAFPESIINAEHAVRAPHIVNVTFPFISHEELVIRLDAFGIMCSAKSACKSGEEGDSHVILAMRKGTQHPSGSIRFSFGRGTRTRDIHDLITHLKRIIYNLQETQKKYTLKN